MNLSLYIAKRYLFSKKSHNAVNIISLISVCGIALATLALVCVLSVFNGLQDVLTATFSAFDPELQISPVQGKVFDVNDEKIKELKNLKGIAFFSESLEENALLRFEDRQQPVVLKGVAPDFENLAQIDKLIIDGSFSLREGDVDNSVIGAGLALNLNLRPGFTTPSEIFIPRRNVRVQLANPSTAFTKTDVFVNGVFALNQPKYDDQMMIISIDLMRELLQYETEVSTLDLKLEEGVSVSAKKQEIKLLLGDEFFVKDRFEQQAQLYKMVNVEKWISFLILAIITMIAIFNIVGSLSMLIIEKKEDIGILQSLGANKSLICKIFLFEGWLITFFGVICGLIVGILVCLIQQYFGILKLGDAGTFIIDAYPVSVHLIDVLIIFLTVGLIGVFAVLYPINNLRKQL